MQLILWRHAEAEDGGANDLERRLSANGRAQAQRVSGWLRKHLPESYTVVASPAVRAQQTAEALNAPILTDKRLAPGASVSDILQAAQAGGVVVLVGHQPDFGRAIAQLVAGRQADWRLKKGALWWIEDDLVKAVVSPELL